MRRRRVLVATLLMVTLGAAAGGAYAAFTATTSNPASTITAAPDWTAPTASATTIARSSGCTPTTPGYVKQGGSYYVYAAVTDTGNPASGISTVTANASALTAAQTAAGLSSGSFSVGGVSYTHRTAAITADAVVSAGAKTYSLTSTDVATNSGTQTGFPVTVDNTAPTATDIQATNKTGGTAGSIENGDTLVLTTAEQVEPCSILSGWNGTSTSVTVRVANVGAADTLAVWDSSNTTLLPFGTIALNGDVVNGNAVFSATMAQSSTTITVTIGSLTSGGPLRTDNSTTANVWTPSTTPYDRAQNAMSTSPATESGAADKSF